MRPVTRHLHTRPRLLLALGLGLACATLVPDVPTIVTRALIGWNVGVWLYLAMIFTMMARANHGKLRRVAEAHAEGWITVSVLIVAVSLASLVAIVLELASAKSGARHALPHAAIALFTVGGSWLLLPTLFTLNYASLYYRTEHGEGLGFPGADERFRPGYLEFLYFSFTIAVAMQTSDVTVTSAAMRRLVLAQSLLAFVFNTTILAFTVNIAASLF